MNQLPEWLDSLYDEEAPPAAPEDGRGDLYVLGIIHNPVVE